MPPYLLPCFLLLVLPSSSRTQQGLSFNVRKLAFSANQFGIDLYRALVDNQEGNIALCPFCVSSTLGMALLGARGSTALALRHVLYLWSTPTQDLHLAVRDLTSHLALNLQPEPSQRRALLEEDPDLVLFRSLYVQRQYGLKYPYQRQLYDYYNVSVHSLDFVMNREEARQHINAIIEKQTGGKVANLLPDTPPDFTNLLLLSGLYFESTVDLDLRPADDVQWKERPGKSRDISGEQLGGNPAMLEARWTRIRHGRHDYLNCTAVEVPLRGGLVSLLALSPETQDAMPLLETRLSAQRLADILTSLAVRRANLKLPRIKIEHSHDNLTGPLSRMGLGALFLPGRAQLYAMSDIPWLHVTNLVHKTSLDLRGRPTLPNPVRGNSGRPSYIGPSEEILELVLNRPFLYFVMDNVSGLVIALGKVVNP